VRPFKYQKIILVISGSIMAVSVFIFICKFFISFDGFLYTAGQAMQVEADYDRAFRATMTEQSPTKQTKENHR
jgi:hypothetical protein